MGMLSELLKYAAETAQPKGRQKSDEQSIKLFENRLKFLFNIAMFGEVYAHDLSSKALNQIFPNIHDRDGFENHAYVEGFIQHKTIKSGWFSRETSELTIDLSGQTTIFTDRLLNRDGLADFTQGLSACLGNKAIPEELRSKVHDYCNQFWEMRRAAAVEAIIQNEVDNGKLDDNTRNVLNQIKDNKNLENILFSTNAIIKHTDLQNTWELLISFYDHQVLPEVVKYVDDLRTMVTEKAFREYRDVAVMLSSHSTAHVQAHIESVMKNLRKDSDEETSNLSAVVEESELDSPEFSARSRKSPSKKHRGSPSAKHRKSRSADISSSDEDETDPLEDQIKQLQDETKAVTKLFHADFKDRQNLSTDDILQVRVQENEVLGAKLQKLEGQAEELEAQLQAEQKTLGDVNAQVNEQVQKISDHLFTLYPEVERSIFKQSLEIRHQSPVMRHRAALESKDEQALKGDSADVQQRIREMPDSPPSTARKKSHESTSEKLSRLQANQQALLEKLKEVAKNAEKEIPADSQNDLVACAEHVDAALTRQKDGYHAKIEALQNTIKDTQKQLQDTQSQIATERLCLDSLEKRAAQEAKFAQQHHSQETMLNSFFEPRDQAFIIPDILNLAKRCQNDKVYQKAYFELLEVVRNVVQNFNSNEYEAAVKRKINDLVSNVPALQDNLFLTDLKRIKNNLETENNYEGLLKRAENADVDFEKGAQTNLKNQDKLHLFEPARDLLKQLLDGPQNDKTKYQSLIAALKTMLSDSSKDNITALQSALINSHLAETKMRPKPGSNPAIAKQLNVYINSQSGIIGTVQRWLYRRSEAVANILARVKIGIKGLFTPKSVQPVQSSVVVHGEVVQEVSDSQLGKAGIGEALPDVVHAPVNSLVSHDDFASEKIAAQHQSDTSHTERLVIQVSFVDQQSSEQHSGVSPTIYSEPVFGDDREPVSESAVEHGGYRSRGLSVGGS